MYQRHDFEIFPVSALEKVRGGVRPMLYEAEGSVLSGERASFQVAYRSIGRTLTDLRYTLTGVPEGCAEVLLVGEVPCSYPAVEGSDDYMLERTPCMMPDVLYPVTAAGVGARCGLWQAFYIAFDGLPAGEYSICFSISDSGGTLLGKTEYALRVLRQKLPESDAVCSFWLHCDSLADYYGLPLFSEEYDAVYASFLDSAVKHGLTMLLTPLFTPPLDTQVGKERMTVQLVDVVREGGAYRFGFSRLERFLRFAREHGVRYFEMSHLFSQWGARFAPKVVAAENGVQRRIFGWDTEALSEEYTAFLAAFLPRLREWLIEKGWYDLCFFHISDEPGEQDFEHYKACNAFVRRFLPDGKFIDAMSHYEFYAEKAVDRPFVALDATDRFIEEGAEGYFVYYCTAQRDKFVSNRFLSMPLERTRILGMQMYLNDVRGFLHWGYNYYYSFLTREPVDPFSVTDCRGKYQSGDAFAVYPGKDGALESLRSEAFLQGMQDLRALRALEEKIGRERVCALLTESGMAKNFTDYPKNPLWLTSLRQKINRLLEKD